MTLRIKRIAMLLVLAVVAIGIPVACMANSPAANAAQGMDEFLKIENSSTEQVVDIFMATIQEQYGSVTGPLPFNVMPGVADTASPLESINIGISEISGLRTQSLIAPLAQIASDTVQYMGTPAYEPVFHVDIALDRAVCMVGATVRAFTLQEFLTVSDTDRAAMQSIVIDEFSNFEANDPMIVEALNQGLDLGWNKCFEDTATTSI